MRRAAHLLEEDCIEIAPLEPPTKDRGLSLADQAFLASAKQLKPPVKSADRELAALDVGVRIELSR